ncbi:MAG: diaminopimelate epimerase, partial [Clostridiales bacterium 43-6]
MHMIFTKMEAQGNDYVYVNVMETALQNPGEISKKISDRRFGIGSDGLILIGKSDVADFHMDMYNSDGSRSEMCGNGIRCVGKYVFDKGLTDKTEFSINTLA